MGLTEDLIAENPDIALALAFGGYCVHRDRRAHWAAICEDNRDAIEQGRPSNKVLIAIASGNAPAWVVDTLAERYPDDAVELRGPGRIAV